MKTSMQTDITARRFGLFKAAEMIADAGFDAIDVSFFELPLDEWIFSDSFEEKAAELRRHAQSKGVYFNQAHAPFPTEKANDAEYNASVRPKIIRSIEVAGILGVRNIVVHPVLFPANTKEENIRMYNSFLPYAEKAGVKIALENMWGTDPRSGYITYKVCSTASELAEFCDALDPRFFTVCLDLGHIGLVREYEAPFIRELGSKRLTCLHVHDTDYRSDLHTAPFTQKLPWSEIADALADIDYSGEITLESDNFIKPMPDALIPDGLKFMYAAARLLADMVEAAKAKK